MPRYLIPVSFLLLSLVTSCTGQATEAATAPAVQDLSVTAFAEKMQAPQVVILDVRTPAETAQGKIEGAREIDYRAPDFAQQIAELDPEPTYLVYCQSGGRSSAAAAQMSELGFTDVYNLVGGYRAWAAARAE
jgi:rhodanese-related sulfurtransferase